MPHTEVPTALAQDGDGFLWVGTDAGIERWDGYHFHTYTSAQNEPCSLPVDVIWALHTDTKGRLWAGTAGGGLARYDRERDCFQAIAASPAGLSSPTIRAIVNDGAGGLWVGTAGGLDHLDPDRLHFVRSTDGARALLGNGVEALLLDRDGALWVGTNGGLVRRSPTRPDFARVPLPSLSGVAPQVRALFQDSGGRVWIGTASDGAYVVQPKTLAVRAVLDVQHRKGVGTIVSIAETPDGEVWLGTQGSGVLAMDPVTLQWRAIRHHAGMPTSLVGDTIEAILRDRSGLMWVANLRGLGYFRVQQALITILGPNAASGVPTSDVTAMVTWNDGRVALGTGQGGVVVIDPRRLRVEPLLGLSSLGSRVTLPGDMVFCLATSDGHDLFAGIRPVGLFWVDASTRQPISVSLPGPRPVEPVYALLTAGQHLWVGGLDGVWVLARQAGGVASPTSWRVVDRLDLPAVWAMTASREGTVWLGTTDGLFRFELSSHTLSHVHFAALAYGTSADAYVSALLIDRHGRLWVGTNSKGILVLDPAAIGAGTVVPERQINEGLPNKVINKLLEDAAGNVWVSTDRDIARIDPMNFSVRAFGRGDGLAISDYWAGSGATTPSGEVLFGGDGGLTVVRPDQFDRLPYHPPVVITSITVGRRTIPSALYNGASIDGPLRVPAGAKSFAVEFAALDYSDPEKNTYAYMLEGYDRDWVRTGSDMRVATYTNLAPGMYRLRLRGTDHAGVWSPSDKVLSIDVEAAWFQMTWFHLIAAVAVLAMVALIVRGRTMVSRARQRELQSLVDLRTAELSKATEERRTLIENVAHDLRTPLTSLRGYLETLRIKDSSLASEDRQKYLEIAFRQSERLTRLIRELFDLVRLEEAQVTASRERFHPAELVQDVVQEFGPIAGGRKIAFETEIGSDPLLIVGDIDLMQRMVENLLDNAIRHTPEGGVITVKLGVDGQWLQLDISDTGQGIGPTELGRIFDRYERGEAGEHRAPGGTGLGLAIVKRIVELHEGTISVHSEVGVGTRFLVRLPLASDAAAAPD